MGMRAACVDLELAELLGPELVVREHAPHRAPDDLLGPPAKQILETLLPEAAWIAAVAGIDPGPQPVPGDPDLPRVDDDDVVAHVHVRRVPGLVLALEESSHLR